MPSIVLGTWDTKIKVWIREMIKWTKCLLHRQEDLRLANSHLKPGTEAHIGKASTTGWWGKGRWMKTGRPQGSLASQHRQNSEFWVH